MKSYKCILFFFYFQFFITLSCAQSNTKKVVIISIDGTPDYLVDKFLDNGVLPSDGAFARMKKEGAFAKSVLPINVASTGPSHVSIFTGASPGKTGIVGNSFRKKDQSWNSNNMSAFNQRFTAETIFQSAMRQGKKVMTLSGVGIDYRDKNRMTDFMHMYPIISGPSLVIDLEITDTIINKMDIESFIKLKTSSSSPSKSFLELYGGFKIPMYFYLKDPRFIPMYLPNQTTNEIFIDLDNNITNGFDLSVDSENWSRMPIYNEGKTFNISFRILKMDTKLGKYRLFMTAPAEIYGNPNEFIQKLQLACGLWPGEPENRKQTTGLISEEIWFEQLDILAKYSKDLILNGLKETQWDLLFGYFSTLDDVQHRYTLLNPRQIDFFADDGKRPKIYQEYIEKKFQLIDAYLLEIINNLPSNTNLIIFSDHGMSPVHTTLLLNEYFKLAGFDDNEQNIKSVSSGNSAHIYINKEKIKKEKFESYLTHLTDSLKNLKDSKTGEIVFKLVANKEQQKKYGLFNSDYSGDLFVSCNSGYSISNRSLEEAKFFIQNSFDPRMFENEDEYIKDFLLNGTMNETGRAVHGGLASSREMQSIFYAIGPDIPNIEILKMSSLQIAPTIAKLLGIQSPKNAEMKGVFN